ncbi:MAG: hypothetical protein O7A98_05890, partial [Acidobacteria bacterium]|nr:hypothetical protein [Acidobacteriota bacterium]
MKPTLVLAAGLLVVCCLSLATTQDPAYTDNRPALAAARAQSLVEPVTVFAADLVPGSVKALRPDREGERSRIESSFSEQEIRQLIAQALALPADPDVQLLGESEGPLGFSLGTSFDSIDVSECCGSGTLNPPDPELAVGPDHVVALVNAAVEVYDKSGTSLVGPIDLESFYSALGGGCTIFAFDPNVLYDESEDRYIIAADGNGDDYCVAVSQTGDAAGAYNLYSFPVDVGGAFFDYPHAGVGVDAIYVGANMFGSGTGRIFAFDKLAMYAGLHAGSVTEDLGSDSTPQPMNIKGSFPTDGKHYIITSRSGAGVFELYSWEDPFGANTLTDVATIDLPAVHGVTVGFGVSSPQSGGGSINSIDPRALDFEYRDGSGWLTNLVSCNPGAGTVNCVQWGQVDVGTATVTQAGVFATEGEYRIFPDLAVNGCGDMLIGYTKTNSGIFPSVWVAGRAAGDPAGAIQGEIEIKAGEV